MRRITAVSYMPVVAMFLLAGLFPAPSWAQVAGQAGEFQARTIRVTGTGEFRVEPDLATVHFAVETTGATAQEAGQANADLMERVIQALIQVGVGRQDIQTSGYSLFPEYAPQPRPVVEPSRIRGYRVMNQVSVRTRQLGQVGRLIDAGLAAGANRLHGVGFEVTDSRAAEAQALQRAIGAARAAAETMAQALGVQLGPVLEASTNAEPVRPFLRQMARDGAMTMEAQAVTPVEPGEQTVHAFASVVFEIR